MHITETRILRARFCSIGVELDAKVPGRVSKIIKDGIFAKAALQKHDELLTIAGKKVTSQEECITLLRRASIDAKVHLRYRRGTNVIEDIVSLKLD